jgi:hypothetical protein
LKRTTGVEPATFGTGFENRMARRRLDKKGVQYSIGVKRHKTVRTVIDAISEGAWKMEDAQELSRHGRGADR